MSVVKRRELNLALFSTDFQCLGLSADLILSEKHVIEAHLIHKAKAIEPLGINKRNEL